LEAKHTNKEVMQLAKIFPIFIKKKDKDCQWDQKYGSA
jgi:hypothetical protein